LFCFKMFFHVNGKDTVIHWKNGNRNMFSVANCNGGNLSMTKDFLTFVLTNVTKALRQMSTWCLMQNGRVMSILKTLDFWRKSQLIPRSNLKLIKKIYPVVIGFNVCKTCLVLKGLNLHHLVLGKVIVNQPTHIIINLMFNY
jgi:hypothetical protein